jgi:hypothetical protein
MADLLNGIRSIQYLYTGSDIFRLENRSVWQIPVFRYGLLMRNRGYIELEKQCWSYLRNIETAINFFFVYERFAQNLSRISHRKIWLNIGICQTLGFSILKMSPRYSFSINTSTVSKAKVRQFLKFLDASFVGEKREKV